MWRTLITALLLVGVPGCLTETRQAQEATTRTTERVGIEQGQPTQVTETTVERKTLDSQAQAGVDVGKAVAAGMAALKGDIVTVLAQMKPADPKPAGFDGTTAGLGLAAAGLGINALRDYLMKKSLAKDRDEGWQKAEEAHAREVELAKQLPPPKA
jgi:hypothetical protein